MPTLVITVNGHCPTKKNAYRQNGKRRFKDPVMARQIDAIVHQIRLQSGNIAPMTRPKISALFYCRDLRPDLDGKWTTLQDALVTAGILQNDNLKHVDNFSVRGEVDKEERVIVRLEV